ncbi:MAG TPA: ATP-binding protein [candidate division WOR-3 bacterium]|uniref:Iron-sulfur cluster carrier protein n=1 Tax=candidate division WOR-3 bacterium TaxID=2052148 RepID=A0A7V0T416_UNCW3|nr:ATP-binding protein [candidate division WOR-3 bacterium]
MAAPGIDPKEQAKIDETLGRIRNRLLVFSGKGGVGKSTVAVNVAVGLALKGRRVGMLDVDIHGPNVAKMLGAEGESLGMTPGEKIRPVEVAHGIKLVSMAYLLEGKDLPVVWRGPMKMRVIQQFLGDVDWGELDWLVIDSPPGTGDEPLTVAQLIPATAALVVTTPQEVALMDTRRAVKFAEMLKLRVLGVVENMSGLACPHCGKEIELFKSGGGGAMAREMLVPLLGRVPIDPAMVGSGDEGLPLISAHPDSPASKVLLEVVERVIEAEVK